MSAESDLYAALAAHSGLTALVGTGANARIYPDALPEGCAYPALAIAATRRPEHGLDNTYFGAWVDFQIACWAATRTAADAVRVQVIACLTDVGLPYDEADGLLDEETAYRASVVTVTDFEQPP